MALTAMVLTVVVSLIGVPAGFIDSADEILAIGAVGVAVTGVAAATGLITRAWRWIYPSVRFVADGPAGDVPYEYRIGFAHPAVATWGAVGLLAGWMALVPILTEGPKLIWAEILGVLALVGFAYVGPSLFGTTRTRLDGSGIHEWSLGLRVPWSSVGPLEVVRGGVAITIAGPVFPTGDQPRRWTDRAIAKHQPGATLRLRTRRPEIVAWIARRYRGTQPDLPRR